jgi:hypothetical protein
LTIFSRKSKRPSNQHLASAGSPPRPSKTSQKYPQRPQANFARAESSLKARPC